MHRRLGKTLGLALILFLFNIPVHAGDSWFSGVDPDPSDQNPTVFGTSGRTTAGDSANSVFDIVISLEADPQGDDDATRGVAGDREQRKYEAIIREFADGVCQSTNTAHMLGTVRIFRNFEQKDSADIIWSQNCPSDEGPRAHPSGFGKSGQHIYMCDNWPGAGGFDPLLDNPKPAGFTLAHEWGHYTYGLYDEYASGPTDGLDYLPRSTDTAASPSIMHNQWCAAGAGCPAGFSSPDLDFLEFSTNRVAPFTSSSTGTNAQKRMFGQSGWETLAQDTKDDPKCLEVFGFTFGTCVPDRTRYTNLAVVAPPSGSDYTVNDSEARCRNSLDIRWMQDDVINELVLDRSGSMLGTPIANAKTAANLLIDQLSEGNAAVGVASFSSNAVQDFPIQDIPDPDNGVKAGAKAAVNRLNAEGGTALFDALLLGLNRAEAFAGSSANSNRAKVVFALSDGDDNESSATADDVISAYRAAGVPIVAFGFGSGAPTRVLQALASETGGRFFFSPTTLAEIQQVFTAANAAVSSSAILADTAILAPPSRIINQPVLIDSTIGDILISLTYTGAIDDLTPFFLDPRGVDTGVSFLCELGAANTVSCVAEVDERVIDRYATGEYTLELENRGSRDVTVNTIITATPAVGGDTYDIAIAITGGATVSYPEEARVTATVTRSVRIAGLVAFADVTDPRGRITRIDLVDDGANGDSFADDGTYSALIDYTMSGFYDVKVTIHCTGQKIKIADIVDKYDALAPLTHSRAASGSRAAPLACLVDLRGCFESDQIHSEKHSWLGVYVFLYESVSDH